MTEYTIHELPNSECRCLHRFCHCIEELRSAAITLLTDLLRQSPPNAPMTPPQVAIAILQRIDELAASAEILLLKGRERDAAVLILSGYELQLDAMYIANDPSRADTWLDHARENAKPWRVGTQQKELFTDPNELVAEEEIYRRLSMVKHCNPVGGLFAFPIAVSRGEIQLDNGTAQKFAPALVFGLGIVLVRTIRAVTRVTSSVGFTVSGTDHTLSELESVLNAVNEESLFALLGEEIGPQTRHGAADERATQDDTGTE